VGDQEPDRPQPVDSFSAILDFVHSLALQNPEAFGRFATEMLRTVGELDRDAYVYFWNSLVSRALLASGVLVALEQAKQALASGDINQASERMNAIGDWVRTIEYLGSRERVAFLLAEEQKTALTGARSPGSYLM
jgi:hypothetical protein